MKGIPYTVEEARCIVRHPKGHDPYAVEMIAFLISEIDRLNGIPKSERHWSPNTETDKHRIDRRMAL